MHSTFFHVYGLPEVLAHDGKDIFPLVDHLAGSHPPINRQFWNDESQ
jgi:hypothetical protein